MYWQDTVRLALKPLRTRFLESLLIVFGVALGVGVITAMLTLILVSTTQLRGLQEGLSAREVRLTIAATDYSRFYGDGTVIPIVKVGRVGDQLVTLRQNDLETIKRAVAGVQYAYLIDYLNIQPPPIGGKRVPDITLRAVSNDLIAAANLKLLYGTWPSKTDFDTRARVIVVTEPFARARFGSINPTNRIISTESGAPYKVIGVFRAPEGSTDFITEHNSLPYLGQGLVPWDIQNVISSRVQDLKFLARPQDASEMLEGLRVYTAKRWGDRVTIKNSSEQIKTAVSTATSAAIVLALFASGGLLISAINITNLMLARVLGRTRGIGVSSALGASRQQIFIQFLTEALVLGLVGGLLGALCAWGLTVALERVLNSGGPAFQASGYRLHLEWLNVFIGLIIGLGVCVLFGLYPAITASRVRPTEALRA